MEYNKIVFSEPWNIQVQEDEIDLEDISPKEIVIKTHYSLISPGTELACLSGKEDWFELPGVPGYASVGEVVEKGSDVNDVDTGEIIYFFGSHSAYQKISNDQFFLELREDLKERLAPFVRMATIAMTSLRVSDIEVGDYVLVTGQGLVGNLAAQLAKLQGGFVVTSDITNGRVEISKKCGVDLSLNPNNVELEKEIEEFTDFNGISTLIEATGSPKVVINSLKHLASEGEIILLGSPRDEFQANITELLRYCHLKEKGNLTFEGAHEWRYPLYHDEFVKHSIERNSRIAFKLIKRNDLNIDPMLTHVIEPQKAKEAYEGLKEEKDNYIGVLIDWR